MAAWCRRSATGSRPVPRGPCVPRTDIAPTRNSTIMTPMILPTPRFPCQMSGGPVASGREGIAWRPKFLAFSCHHTCGTVNPDRSAATHRSGDSWPIVSVQRAIALSESRSSEDDQRYQPACQRPTIPLPRVDATHEEPLEDLIAEVAVPSSVASPFELFSTRHFTVFRQDEERYHAHGGYTACPQGPFRSAERRGDGPHLDGPSGHREYRSIPPLYPGLPRPHLSRANAGYVAG